MIYLVQTDTTAGFLSKNLHEINHIKNRDLNQPCFITTASFNELLNFPRVLKNLARKTRKNHQKFINHKNKNKKNKGLKNESFNTKFKNCINLLIFI